MLTPEEKAEEKERLKLAYEKYVEEQKEKMLAKIKALGYNPDAYEIQYELVDGEKEE